MEKIIVIGANEYQERLIKTATRMGYETHVFAWEDGAVGRESANSFYPISIVEKEQILDIAKKLNPTAICSIASDLAMPTVNYIADKLKLVGNSLFCTKVTTNKYEMRKILSENHLPCPKYQQVKDINDIDNNINFPVIVKPVDRSGSRGIYKVKQLENLEFAIRKSKEVTFENYVLVEEYIEGKEYSVEFISQDGKHYFLQITEKFTTGEPNFIEKGHLAPARISDQIKNQVIQLIEKSLTVLKIDNGASHSEIKIKPNREIVIIEIAGRMGGDFIGSDMVEISTGVDFVKQTINVAINKKVELPVPISNKSIAFVGFIFEQSDTERLIEVQSKYPQIVKEYRMKDSFENVCDSASRNGYYILQINSENLDEILNLLNMEA